MAYCTLADLVSRYSERDLIQRTDRDGLGVVDEALVDAAIARADADIDGALADAGFATPVAGWSRTRVYAEALAMRYLYADGPAPKEIMDDYAAAQAWLERVSQGAVRPPVTVAEADTPPAAGAASYAAPDATFTPDTLADWR